MITRLEIAAVLLLILLAGGWYYGHTRYVAGIDHQQAITAKQDAKAAVEARKHEQAEQARIAELAQQYEQDKTDAQAQYDRDVADLRSGQLRLRKQWTCPRLPAVAASSGEPDADTQIREQGAADLIRNAAEADSTIRALQGILTAERQR